MEENREKRLVSFRVWSDEYDEFKAVCRAWRTTPTAKVCEYFRETVKAYNEEKAKEEK